MEFDEVTHIVFLVVFSCLAAVGLIHMIYVNWFQGTVIWMLCAILINQHTTHNSGGANNG